MSTHWNGQDLLEPVTAEEPCGKNLEDTETLASIDAYQIFGQTTLEPSNDGAAVSVQDSGPGIEPQDLPRLFDRYFQAQRARELATRKALVRARQVAAVCIVLAIGAIGKLEVVAQAAWLRPANRSTTRRTRLLNHPQQTSSRCLCCATTRKRLRDC